MLIIWDILLLPSILLNAYIHILSSGLDDIVLESIRRLPEVLPDLFVIVFLYFAAFSQYFIPQIITLVLILLNFTIPFRFWEPTPTRKDIIQRVLLSVFAVIGAICAFISVFMLSDGRGYPIS